MFKKSNKAFTLLELIIVLVVLGILAALAVPSFAKVQKNAAAAVAKSTAKSIARDANSLGAQNIGSSAGTTMFANVDTAYSEVIAPSNATITDPAGSGETRITVTGGGQAQECLVTISGGKAVTFGFTASGLNCA
jgi:prepilin-type N-terminal cleavage/methylation domain-containing protein